MVEIHIPDFYSDDNWPIVIYGADRFLKAMFYYGDGEIVLKSFLLLIAKKQTI